MAVGRVFTDPGPAEGEYGLLRSFRRGRRTPWLTDTDPIPFLPVVRLCCVTVIRLAAGTAGS